MATPTSVYAELVAAGIPTESHESDLYVPDTVAARAILARFPDQQRIATRFVCIIEQTAWIAIPFAYLPWWEARQEVRR